MEDKQTTIDLVAGLDLGNGYVKAVINNQLLVYPSVAVKYYSNQAESKLGAADVPYFVEHIFDTMDVSFNSPLVRDTARRFLGHRALNSGLPLEEFDVFGNKGKADVDLSGVLALGGLAAQALKYYYDANHTLPSDRLTLRVKLATALPIGEFKRNHNDYRNRYLNGGQPHTVTFYNFEQLITIDFVFEAVYVSNEGESAQYGLMTSTDEFLAYVAKEAVKRYPDDSLNDITGRELVSASHTLGIDIGEGTIDFAVFTDGRFNADASSNVNIGFGEVLENSLELAQMKGSKYKSRKHLCEFVYKTPEMLTRAKHKVVTGIVRDEAYKFAQQVSLAISKVYDRVGGDTQVIFVYGGGASLLEDALYPLIASAISTDDMGQSAPIVYLNSEYSRYLNVQGLHQLATRI